MLRRLRQQKRRIQIELCVGLSALRLLSVDHVVQSRRGILSLAWHEWFFMLRQRMKDLLLWARFVVRTSNTRISRRHLADHINKLRLNDC